MCGSRVLKVIALVHTMVSPHGGLETNPLNTWSVCVCVCVLMVVVWDLSSKLQSLTGGVQVDG